MHFVGRQTELNTLKSLLKKKSAGLAVIRGRRRIGKSRLIQEFTKNIKCLNFSGLPPTQGVTKSSQIEVFANQMSQNLRMPKLKTTDWGELFWHLANMTKQGQIVIVFDEISWMGSKDINFLGLLKNAWDLYFSKNTRLILILCGSVSCWIEKNILSNTGFVGRISLNLVVGELPLEDCNKFWGAQKNRISAYEKLKILSVTGGVPKYLEEIIPVESAEENILRLCFKPEGLLYREYDQIFSELFSKKAFTFNKIVQYLTMGSLNLDEICTLLKIKKSGNISEYMGELILAGFIAEDATWDIKSQNISRLKRFRLSDNYLRFYLKYIQPKKEKIAKGLFTSRSLTNLSGWEIIMGFQFENLVLNNLQKICTLLKIDKQDISMAGRFFQRKTKRKKGCQIDLLLQTRYHSLYLCEIKFCVLEVSKKVVNDVQKKIKRLSYPRGYSIRPVLIHVNGVSQTVKKSDFFDHIIDFSSFFDKQSSNIIYNLGI